MKDDHFSLMKYCQSLQPGQRSEGADVLESCALLVLSSASQTGESKGETP